MPGEEGTTAIVTETPQGGAVPDPESGPAPIMIPKSRFDEVNRAKQSYERFGSPEQIQAAMERLAYYSELERQATEEASHSKTGEATDETQKRMEEANKALFQVEPRLAKAIAGGDFKDAHEMRCRIIATDETGEILKEMGLEATKEEVGRMGMHLRPYLESDPVAHAEFFTDPRRAIRRIYKTWQKYNTEQAERTKPKETPESPHNKLPRAGAPPGGGPPGGKNPPPPASTMRELQQRVTAKLTRLKDGEI